MFYSAFSILAFNMKRQLFALGALLMACWWAFPLTSQAQCTNPTIPLPDASTPVNGNPATAYCTTFSFNPSITGLPTGLSMNLQHTWQGDLSIFIIACGQTLMVLNRPGVVGSCAGGCPCGNSNDIGTPGNPVLVTFSDGGGPDPENGIALTGGNYGVTADNSCGVSTVSSFAQLWSSCPPGNITAQVCIADHAGADVGVAADVTFMYPNPVVCGCTNPNSPNYNPNANVDDGSCIPNCPAMSVNASFNNTVACPGGTVGITTSVTGNPAPTVTYAWSGPNASFLSSTTSPNPTVNIPAGFSGTLTLNLTVTSGPCVQSTSISMSVAPPPPPVINGPPGLCTGQSTAVLTVSGTYNSYAWASPPGGSSPTIVVSTPGTYTVTVTDANGCPSSSSFTLNAFPPPFVQITGPSDVCLGGTATLSAGAGFNSYQWSTGSTSPTTTITQPGFYFVTVTDANGCSNSAQYTVTTAPAPVPGILGNNQICPNSTLTLSAEPGYSNFQWSTGSSASSIVITGPGVYSLTATNSEGCIGTNSITVTSLNIAQPIIQGASTICPGAQSNLMVQPSYSSYQWSNGQGGQSITVDQPGTYSVTVTNAQGCSATASFNIALATTPTPAISGNLTVCPGQNAVLNAGGPYASYSWSDGSTGQTAVISQIGPVSVTVTNSQGCAGVANATVVQAPTPNPNISGPSQICPGQTATLNAGAGFSSYNWSNGANAAQVTVNVPNTYSVTVTNAQGCSASASFTLSPAPVPNPSITGALTICQGASTTLSTEAGFGTYAWSSGGNGPSISVSTAGTYTVTVTNSAGCSSTASAVLMVNANPNPVISGSASFCPGGSTMLVAVGNFSAYSWSTGAQSPSITASTAGAYTLTVTDANGCTGSTSINVQQLPSPVPQITGSTSFCVGTSTTLDAGAGYVTYQWSDGGGNGQTATFFATGTYSVTVSDTNGCTGSSSVTVNELPAVTVSITGAMTLCTGQSSALLSASAGFATYAWSDGQTAQQISVNAGGVYQVTATDSNGCSGTASATVIANAPPSVSISGALQYCQGASTVLTATAGLSSYQWSNGASGVSITVGSPGTYTVVVTDANGCSAQAAVSVVQNPNPTPQISGSNQFCAGGQTTLTATGGNFSSYLWSTSSTQSSITVSNQGNYSVTVTDANGCSASAARSVVQVPLPTPQISGSLAICQGQSTTLGATGGSFASFAWTGGDTTSQITVSSGGVYSLTVTDANGCSASTSATVTVNALPVFSIEGTPAFCAGASTLLSAPVGFAAYIWSNNSSSNAVTINMPGSYSVTVTDANGCSSSQSISVIQNANPSLAISGVLQFCTGASTVLSASISNVSYQWSNGQTTPAITVSTPGNYGLTVTDANGCSSSTVATVVQIPMPQPAIFGALQFCAGSSTTLSGSAGFAAYRWSDNTTDQQVVVNTPGVYGLTVTDANGCTGTASATVAMNPLPVFNIEGNPAFCAGASTSLNVAPAFSAYSWSTGATTSGISINTPGNYAVTVTDANGCSASRTQQVVQHTNPTLAITGVLQICIGGSTVLNASIANVSYQWSNNQTTSAIQVSAAGNYSLTVTDANGCSDSASVIVTQVPQLQPVISGVLFFCAGTSTTLDGGNGYATYRWSNNANTQQLTVSTPGTYGLTVTDANGCSGQASVDVTERPLPSPQITGALQYCQGGSTTLSSSTAFQSYQWSTGATAQSITLSTPGTVRLTVTDAFGCSGAASVSVVEHPLVFPSITGNLSFCQGLQTILDAGAGFVTYQWSNNANTPSITVTSGGSYAVTVIDANGCVTNGSVSVTEFPVIPPQITGTFTFCTGQSVVLDAGAGYAAYQWSNSANGRTISISQGGFYSVTATDSNGCASSSGVQVTQHPLPDVQIGGSASFCVGGFTTLNAGNGFAQYLWSNGSTAPTIQISQPGVVSVTVTDSNGCVNSDDITIIQDTELSPQINGNLQFCPGTQTTLDAGSGYTTYQWSNNANTQSITVTQPGAYSVTVTDAFGCLGSGTVQVELFPQPQLQIAGTPSFCAGASTTLSSATPFSAYRWSTGAIQPQITVSAPGLYVLTVTDANGCSAVASQAVQEFPLPVFSISGANFFCTGGSTTISVPANFTAYGWSNAQTTPSITVNTPGTYVVTVTNNFGCVASHSVQIAQIPLPIADAGPARELTCNEPVTILGGSATSQGAAYVYHWAGPGITASNENLRQPQVNQAGAYSLVVTDSIHGCVSSPANTFVADLTALPTVVVAALDTLDCVTPAVVISGAGSSTGADIAYQWLGANQTPIAGANTMNYTATQPGQYTLRVRNTYTGCISERTAVVLQDVEIPAAEAGTPRHLTCIVTSDVLNGAGSATGNTITYQWTTQDGGIVSEANTLMPTVNRPGLYILRVTNQRNGCSNTDTVQVTQDITPPLANAGQDREIDCLNPSVRIDGTGSSNGAGVRYEWTRNGESSLVSTDLSFEVTIPGTYTLRVINLQNGCSASDVMVVSENSERPRALNVITDNPTCFGDADGSILIGGITGGTPPYLYSINGGPFRAQTFYPNLSGGNYRIVVQDATGCELVLDTNLREGNALVLDLGPDQFIRLGQHARIEAQYNIPQNEVRLFRWTSADTLPCLDCAVLDLRPFITTTYAAELVDTNGCRISDQVTIYVEKPFEIFVPTAFSPNNDGTNDRLLVFAGEDVEYIQAFQVFNRWGESTFEVYNFPPNDPTYGWDGSDRSRLYNSNVFVWYAEVRFIDGTVKLFKGDVTLMR